MSYRPLVLVTAPVGTRSGYGSHSRDICRSLIDMDKFDVKIWQFVGEQHHRMHLTKKIHMINLLLIGYLKNRIWIDNQIFIFIL